MEISVAITTTPSYLKDSNYPHYLYDKVLYDSDYSIVNKNFIQNYEIKKITSFI